MLEQFFDNLGTRRPDAEESFYGVLERHHDLLESYGFFHFLRTAGGRSRRSTRPTPSS